MDKPTRSTKQANPELPLRELIRRALDAAVRDAKSGNAEKRAGHYAPTAKPAAE